MGKQSAASSAASEMARKRWAKTTESQRREFAMKLVAARGHKPKTDKPKAKRSKKSRAK